MFNLFTKEKENENDESHLSLISIAALLIHSAKIDQNFTEKEKNIIKNALIQMGAAEDTLDEIIKDAETKECHMPDRRHAVPSFSCPRAS